MGRPAFSNANAMTLARLEVIVPKKPVLVSLISSMCRWDRPAMRCDGKLQRLQFRLLLGLRSRDRWPSRSSNRLRALGFRLWLGRRCNGRFRRLGGGQLRGISPFMAKSTRSDRWSALACMVADQGLAGRFNVGQPLALGTGWAAGAQLIDAVELLVGLGVVGRRLADPTAAPGCARPVPRQTTRAGPAAA